MKWFLLLLTLGMIVVHQDFSNWAKIDPRFLGFLPVGLWYHALYCVAASLLLWMFVAFAWPKHLEQVEREVSGADEPTAGHGTRSDR